MSGFDVVVPCYRYGRFLRDCVRSILTQEGVDVRVLVIDDCSPDDTPDVAAQLVKEDSRVEYRRHAVNRGHIATYNEGLLEWARSEYSVLLSADDLLVPGSLGRAAVVLDSHPDTSFACGRMFNFESTLPDIKPSQGAPRFNVMDGTAFLRATCTQGLNLVCTPTVVVRTRIQQAVGGYRAELPHSGDMEMWMRCALRGRVAVIDAYQAFYRVHGCNMHRSLSRTAVAELEHSWATFESVFETEGQQISDLTALRRLAAEAISRRAVAAASRVGRDETAEYRALIDLAHRLRPPSRLDVVAERLWWRWRLSWKLRNVLRRIIRRQAGIRIGSWPSLTQLCWSDSVNMG